MATHKRGCAGGSATEADTFDRPLATLPFLVRLAAQPEERTVVVEE
jgi:hypothetical protein